VTIWRGNLRSVTLGHHFSRPSQHVSVSVELRQVGPDHPVVTGGLRPPHHPQAFRFPVKGRSRQVDDHRIRTYHRFREVTDPGLSDAQVFHAHVRHMLDPVGNLPGSDGRYVDFGSL
jgi:hypothetical protein